MQVHFDDHDFIGAQAVTTAAVMRALADALAPKPTITMSFKADNLKVDALNAHVHAEPQIAATTTVVSDPSEPEAVEYVEQAAPAGGVDSEGYPWDERIHASSRSTVADGTWRRKRGVDDALVASVRAEWDEKLRPAPAAPTEAERLQADHVSTMPAEEPTALPVAIDPAAVGFGTAAAQVPPPPPTAPAAGDAWPDDILGPRVDTMAPFPQFMAWAGKQIQAGALDNARLLSVLQEHSVPILPALSAPEHVGKISAIARQLAGA